MHIRAAFSDRGILRISFLSRPSGAKIVTTHFLRIAALAVTLAACAVPASASDEAALAADARKIALGLQQTLAGKLLAEIKKNGPESAISVCKTLAPEASAEISRNTGWRVTRVSLKVRNPVLGMPDPWEQKALLDINARAAQGADPAGLERAEIVSEPQGRYFRYVKALPVQPLCLNCHGAADAVPAPVKARLATEYPHDRATGYAPGQIRGAISLKRALD
jgi:hypothetical protein